MMIQCSLCKQMFDHMTFKNGYCNSCSKNKFAETKIAKMIMKEQQREIDKAQEIGYEIPFRY